MTVRIEDLLMQRTSKRRQRKLDKAIEKAKKEGQRDATKGGSGTR